MSTGFSHYSGNSTSRDSAISTGNRYYEQQSSSPNGFRRRERRQSFDEFRSGFGGIVGMYQSMKTRLDGPALAPAKVSEASRASSSSDTSTTGSSTTSSSSSQKRESFDDFRSGYKGIVSIFKSWLS
jgi:hypothetical protein